MIENGEHRERADATRWGGLGLNVARVLDDLDRYLRRAALARRCAWCETSLDGQRSHARYCSTAHRCRAWRRRRALILNPTRKETR